MVIDNRTVITGSFNWSPSVAHQTGEVLLVIKALEHKPAKNRRRCRSDMQRQ